MSMRSEVSDSVCFWIWTMRTDGEFDLLEQRSDERKSLGNDGLSIMKDRTAKPTGEDRSP